jgi:hypothetical protein
MEDLMERAATSPVVEDLMHRLRQPSMISGSDIPANKVTLSGGESMANLGRRPASESMADRNHRARLTRLMAGKKVSKERRHSLVLGKGRELMKPQGYRKVATAVPMVTRKKEEKEGGVGVVVGKERRAREKKKKVPQVNYYGYSTQ